MTIPNSQSNIRLNMHVDMSPPASSSLIIPYFSRFKCSVTPEELAIGPWCGEAGDITYDACLLLPECLGLVQHNGMYYISWQFYEENEDDADNIAAMHKVYVLDAVSGELLFCWGKPGASSQLGRVDGMWLTDAGNILVADGKHKRLEEFTVAGAHVKGVTHGCTGCVFSRSLSLVASFLDQTVNVWTSAGVLVSSFEVPFRPLRMEFWGDRLVISTSAPEDHNCVISELFVYDFTGQHLLDVVLDTPVHRIYAEDSDDSDTEEAEVEGADGFVVIDDFVFVAVNASSHDGEDIFARVAVYSLVDGSVVASWRAPDVPKGRPINLHTGTDADGAPTLLVVHASVLDEVVIRTYACSTWRAFVVTAAPSTPTLRCIPFMHETTAAVGTEQGVELDNSWNWSIKDMQAYDGRFFLLAQFFTQHIDEDDSVLSTCSLVFPVQQDNCAPRVYHPGLYKPCAYSVKLVQTTAGPPLICSSEVFGGDSTLRTFSYATADAVLRTMQFTLAANTSENGCYVSTLNLDGSVCATMLMPLAEHSAYSAYAGGDLAIVGPTYEDSCFDTVFVYSMPDLQEKCRFKLALPRYMYRGDHCTIGGLFFIALTPDTDAPDSYKDAGANAFVRVAMYSLDSGVCMRTWIMDGVVRASVHAWAGLLHVVSKGRGAGSIYTYNFIWEGHDDRRTLIRYLSLPDPTPGDAAASEKAPSKRHRAAADEMVALLRGLSRGVQRLCPLDPGFIGHSVATFL